MTVATAEPPVAKRGPGRPRKIPPVQFIAEPKFDCLPLVLRRLSKLWGPVNGEKKLEWSEAMRFLSVHTGLAACWLLPIIDRCGDSLDPGRPTGGGRYDLSQAMVQLAQFAAGGGYDLFLDWLQARFPETVESVHDQRGWDIDDIRPTLGRV